MTQITTFSPHRQEPKFLEEATLFARAQAGCLTSLDELMSRHQGLVHAVVRRQRLGNLTYAEAVQAGRIGLWRAILNYDPSRGTTFSSYAWPAIARAIQQEVARASPSLVPQTNLSIPQDDEPEDFLHQAEVHVALHRLVDRLPPKLREVVVAYYGLNGEPPLSLRKLGHLFGLSHEAIRQRLLSALVWLRHPAHSQELRQLLDRNSVDEYRRAHHLAQEWRKKRRGGSHG